LALQHVFLMSSTLVLPAVLVAQLGGSAAASAAAVAFTMMACGLGTVFQAARLPGFGSGFLCPNLAGPNFFSASLNAAWLGGMPLLRGMTIFAGAVELLFARLLPRIAFLFPTEITGVVVFFVGVGLVPLGISKFVGVEYAEDPLIAQDLAVSALALGVMGAVHVFGSRQLRLYGVLLGMIAGYALAAVLGILSADAIRQIHDSAWFGVPTFAGWSQVAFRWSLAPSFMIVSICGALKSMGNLLVCEKTCEPTRQAPDMQRLCRGLTADAAAVTISGFLGGVASDTSSSNVSLTAATSAVSRRIAFAAGGLFFCLGFSPKLATILATMPPPVAGAILVFVTCFMILSGRQIITSVPLDRARGFAVALALFAGLSVVLLPGAFARVSPWLRPLFANALTLATTVAVVATQLTHLGRKRASTQTTP
jgi:NCS2 family nucleobase:cation symporter-2